MSNSGKNHAAAGTTQYLESRLPFLTRPIAILGRIQQFKMPRRIIHSYVLSIPFKQLSIAVVPLIEGLPQASRSSTTSHTSQGKPNGFWCSFCQLFHLREAFPPHHRSSLLSPTHSLLYPCFSEYISHSLTISPSICIPNFFEAHREFPLRWVNIQPGPFELLTRQD